jgi:hypothetical protein
VKVIILSLLLYALIPTAHTLAREESREDRAMRDKRPHWCDQYNWRSYRRDMRQCRRDWECRARVERKGALCGHKG